MGHLSRRGAVMVATPILALGILVGGFRVASASPTDGRSSSSGISTSETYGGRDHSPDHVSATTAPTM